MSERERATTREGATRLRLRWSARVGVMLLLLFPLAVGVVMLRANVHDRQGLRTTLFLAVSLGAVVPYLLLVGQGHVDGEGVTARQRSLRMLHVPWGEVASIAWTGSAFIVRDRRGGALTLAAKLVGIDAFAKLALAKAGGAVVGIFSRGALEARTGEAPPRAAWRLVEELAPDVDARARWRDNPFLVLGLAPACSAMDVERAGQKLLGLLEIGASSARSYATPFGPADRTAEKVRAAMAELRDPERRIAHEVWAAAPEAAEVARARDAEAHAPARGWAEAMRAAGFRGVGPG